MTEEEVAEKVAEAGFNLIEDEIVEKKPKGNYIFPDILGKVMSKVSQRIQYEAEMMSLSIILLGLISTGIYVIFFTDLDTIVKVMTSINCGAGFILLSSRLVTSFQQYKNYLAMVGIIDEVGR